MDWTTESGPPLGSSDDIGMTRPISVLPVSGRTLPMSDTERVQNIIMGSMSEETKTMYEMMGFSDFHSSKGGNDFEIWSATCVDGKTRESLADFEDYMKWENNRLNDRM